MRIGVPKEVKNNEYRVAMTPGIAHELHIHGHEIFIEASAGVGSGYSDEEYLEAGANIVQAHADIFDQASLILKVKEPQSEERKLLTSKHTLFTYLHLAPDIHQTSDLLKSGATCIAYETVENSRGQLVLLTPMSEIAGRMSVQAGANCLEKSKGGRGILLSGAPGVPAANVLILGGGVVGRNAATIALGMGADVCIIDKSVDALRDIEAQFSGRVKTLYSSRTAILSHLPSTDLLVGAVLIPGAEAPKLIQKDDLKLMQEGAVIVDVAIDQGGCIATSKPTTHAAPSFVVDGITHYCVANMPGAVARTSTQALTNATFPYVMALADKGCKEALAQDPGFLKGLNIVRGKLSNGSVAQAQKLEHIPLKEALDEL